MQITVQQEWVFYLLEFCMIACCILLSVVIKKKTFSLISGLVPLHNACSYGHYEVAELLVRHGASVNVADLWKFTPLHEAAAKGKYEICKLLLKVCDPEFLSMSSNVCVFCWFFFCWRSESKLITSSVFLMVFSVFSLYSCQIVCAMSVHLQRIISMVTFSSRFVNLLWHGLLLLAKCDKTLKLEKKMNLFKKNTQTLTLFVPF